MAQRIIYTDAQGNLCFVIPLEGSIEEVVANDLPAGVDYVVVDESEIPTDRTFRGAWTRSGNSVTHDLDKCKTIGHDIRRRKREEEFAPHDEVIIKQIPGSAFTSAEASRQAIRDKYAVVQTDIDNATSPEQIKAILEAAK
jgi:hypothetical protein